jgi:hypothetical protein
MAVGRSPRQGLVTVVDQELCTGATPGAGGARPALPPGPAEANEGR